MSASSDLSDSRKNLHAVIEETRAVFAKFVASMDSDSIDISLDSSPPPQPRHPPPLPQPSPPHLPLSRSEHRWPPPTSMFQPQSSPAPIPPPPTTSPPTIPPPPMESPSISSIPDFYTTRSTFPRDEQSISLPKSEPHSMPKLPPPYSSLQIFADPPCSSLSIVANPISEVSLPTPQPQPSIFQTPPPPLFSPSPPPNISPLAESHPLQDLSSPSPPRSEHRQWPLKPSSIPYVSVTYPPPPLLHTQPLPTLPPPVPPPLDVPPQYVAPPSISSPPNPPTHPPKLPSNLTDIIQSKKLVSQPISSITLVMSVNRINPLVPATMTPLLLPNTLLPIQCFCLTGIKESKDIEDDDEAEPPNPTSVVVGDNSRVSNTHNLIQSVIDGTLKLSMRESSLFHIFAGNGDFLGCTSAPPPMMPIISSILLLERVSVNQIFAIQNWATSEKEMSKSASIFEPNPSGPTSLFSAAQSFRLLTIHIKPKFTVGGPSIFLVSEHSRV